MQKATYLIFIILNIHFGIFAQSGDSITFSKGRVLTSLYGALSNKQVSNGTMSTAHTSGYTIGSKSGKFLINNWVLGVDFTLSKTDYSNNIINLDFEDLSIGLWSRFYFAHKGATSLYADLTPYYAVIFRNEAIWDSNGNKIANREVFGQGFGINPGLGFTYILNKNVGFGVALSNPLAWISSNTSNLITNTSTHDTYFSNKLLFTFNFQIFIDQFFF